MLFGENTVAGNRVQTKLSEVMMQEINAKLAVGAWPKVDRSELFSARDRQMLDEMVKDFATNPYFKFYNSKEMVEYEKKVGLFDEEKLKSSYLGILYQSKI